MKGMREKKTNGLLKLWAVSSLPDAYVKTDGSVRDFILKLVIHPVKRRIARYYLLFLRKFFGIKVVGITGSAGKTSTKEMIASVLGRKFKTASTPGNIDPVYSIPTTILKCSPATKYLVAEMGIEYPGEMDFYLWLAKPDISVVTNIYYTHTLYLGAVDGVIREKGKIVTRLSRNSWAVINGGDKNSLPLAEKTEAKTVVYGEGGTVRAENVSIQAHMSTKYTLVTDVGKEVIQLAVLGRSFVENSLAAACVGIISGVSLKDIKAGLESFSKQPHRMQAVKSSGGFWVLDDSYNSNPLALRNATEAFCDSFRGMEKIAVVGDMLELGRYEGKFHRQMGTFIAGKKVDYLVAVGDASKTLASSASAAMPKERVFWTRDHNGAFKIIRPLLGKNTAVLVKGSRSLGLERLVSRLLAQGL